MMFDDAGGESFFRRQQDPGFKTSGRELSGSKGCSSGGSANSNWIMPWLMQLRRCDITTTC
jgi:hypothetical protein